MDAAPMAVDAPPRRTLEIANLTKRVSPENIREIFGRYGPIARLSQPRGPDNRPTGTTWAVFESPEAAAAAQRAMHGGLVDGQAVSVSLSDRDVPARAHGRRTRGGRGRRGRSRSRSRSHSRSRVVRRTRSRSPADRGSRLDHYAGAGRSRRSRSRSPGRRPRRSPERASGRMDSYRPRRSRSRSPYGRRRRSPSPY